MLIVLEGIDGCGKDSVADAMVQTRKNTRKIAFPRRDSPTGELIDGHLKGKFGFPPTVFQALQVTNRMEVMAELRLAADYAAVLDVICVRYWQSGWVYGQLDGLSKNWLYDIHSAMAKPQVNILLDVEPKVAIERRRKRSEKAAERYEGSEVFLQKTRELYLKLWRDPPSLTSKWVTIDAGEPLNEVVKNCLKACQ